MSCFNLVNSDCSFVEYVITNIAPSSRRKFIKTALELSSASVLVRLAPTWAKPLGRGYGELIHNDVPINLLIEQSPMIVAGKSALPITLNSSFQVCSLDFVKVNALRSMSLTP
jgi:hypothetical protein